MVTVSFLVSFVQDSVNVTHHHDICVYEYIHAPGFKLQAKEAIISFVNNVYGKQAYGYTHFITTFTYPLGKVNMHDIVLQRKKKKQNVFTL